VKAGFVDGFDVASHFGGAIKFFVADVALDFETIVDGAHVDFHVSRL